MIRRTAILIILFFLSRPGYGTVEVYPTRIEKETLPGQVTTNYYVIKNNNQDDEIEVTINYKDWFRLKENRMISVAEYLVIDPLSFTLNPGEKKAIRCIASAPDKAVGELVSMIYFNYRENKDVEINTKFGVSLYLAIKGTVIKKGVIHNIQVQRYQNNNIKNYIFSIEILNTGNVHLRPVGSIKIRNQYDEYVTTVDLDYGWPVYPGQKYKYTGKFNTENDLTGKFNAELNIDKLSDQGIIRKEFEFEIKQDGQISVKPFQM